MAIITKKRVLISLAAVATVAVGVGAYVVLRDKGVLAKGAEMVSGLVGGASDAVAAGAEVVSDTAAAAADVTVETVKATTAA